MQAKQAKQEKKRKDPIQPVNSSLIESILTQLPRRLTGTKKKQMKSSGNPPPPSSAPKKMDVPKKARGWGNVAQKTEAIRGDVRRKRSGMNKTLHRKNNNKTLTYNKNNKKYFILPSKVKKI